MDKFKRGDRVLVHHPGNPRWDWEQAIYITHHEKGHIVMTLRGPRRFDNKDIKPFDNREREQ